MNNEEKILSLIESLAINMNNQFEELKGKIDIDFIEVNKKIDKNTVMIEKMQNSIELLSEGQQNILEQNELQHNEIMTTIKENKYIQDIAIKNMKLIK